MENANDAGYNVFWGPVTSTEIKKILSHKKPPEKIGRRNTISEVQPTRTIYADSPETNLLIKRHFFGDSTDDVNVSFTSEYLTPNETVGNDKSNIDNNEASKNTKESKETLIDKISKALDISSCRTSPYASAGECSNCTSFAPTNINEIHMNETYTCGNRSHYNHSKNEYLLILSDDEDLNNSKLEESYKNVEVENTDAENHDVIVISDDDDVLYVEPMPIKIEMGKSLCSSKIDVVHLNMNEISLLDEPSISRQVNKDCSKNYSLIGIINREEFTESKLNFSEISQHLTDEEASCLSSDGEQSEKYCNVDLTTDTSYNYDEVSNLKLDLSKNSQYEEYDRSCIISENQNENSINTNSHSLESSSHDVEENVLETSHYEEGKCTSVILSIHEQSHKSHNSIANESHRLNTEVTNKSYKDYSITNDTSYNQNKKLTCSKSNFIDFSNPSDNAKATYVLSSCEKTVKSCNNSYVNVADEQIISVSPAQEVLDNYNRNLVINISVNQDDEENEDTNYMNATPPTSENSQPKWNDTIEEMEKFLQHADENNHDTTTSDYPQELHDSTRNDSKLYSDSFTSKPKKSFIPIKNSNQFLNSPKKFYSAKQNTNFKIPTKIASVKSNYKNIPSPVAVYIKNSPQTPLRQRIPAKPLSATALFPKATSSKVSNKENEFDLPTRIYKPGKHTVISEQEQLKLPGNIQKHISHIPNIIKHRGRAGGKTLNQNMVESKLLNENLTISDDSRFSTSTVEGDISLLVSKKAYIK